MNRGFRMRAFVIARQLQWIITAKELVRMIFINV